MFIPTASPIKSAAHDFSNPKFPLSLLYNTELLHSMDVRNAREKKKDVQRF